MKALQRKFVTKIIVFLPVKQTLLASS